MPKQPKESVFGGVRFSPPFRFSLAPCLSATVARSRSERRGTSSPKFRFFRLFRYIAIVWAWGAFAHNETIKLFSGSSNRPLAEAVAREMGMPLTPAKVERFNDGEIRIQVLESVRNCDVFILQSTCPAPHATVNDSLVELFLMIRTMKRASAKSVTAVIPYFGYARQDRKMVGRVPISASDVAMLLETAGADHVMAVDLHCGQIQGFFHEVPVDNLFASTIFVPYVARLGLYDPVIVSPDAGGVERAKVFIEGLESFGVQSRMAIFVKQRADAGVIESMKLVGRVDGCDVVIVDDICDTAGTLVQAARELKNQGARRVYACITHPLLSGPACARIESSPLDGVVVTDTVPLRGEVPRNILQLTVAPLLARAIERTWKGESLADLFSYREP